MRNNHKIKNMYQTVYDYANKEFELLTLFPLIFVFIGIGIAWFYIKNKQNPKREFGIVFGFVFVIFASIGLLISVSTTIPDKRKMKKINKEHSAKIVEGVIENFHPMPAGGHDKESFTVNHIYFEYSDYYIDFGFHNSASHGGPITRNGQQVRLTYITERGRNKIIKIELKNEN